MSHELMKIEPAKKEYPGANESCSSNAAMPIAATTTNANGLKNARRLVYKNHQPRAASNRPAAMMVARCEVWARAWDVEESSGTRSLPDLYRPNGTFSKFRCRSGIWIFEACFPPPASHSAGSGSPFFTAYSTSSTRDETPSLSKMRNRYFLTVCSLSSVRRQCRDCSCLPLPAQRPAPRAESKFSSRVS